MEEYSNYSIEKLLKEVVSYKPSIEMPTITQLYNLICEKEKSAKSATLFVRALRKGKNYPTAEEYHNKFSKLYPNHNALKSEYLWLKLFSGVIHNSDNDYFNNADDILKVTSQHNSNTKLIYEFTVLVTLSRLLKDGQYDEAYKWLSKLNPLLLSEKERINEITGENRPSDKSQFYWYKTRVLIGLNIVPKYFSWLFKTLNFTQKKTEEFVKSIISKSTFEKYDGSQEIFAPILRNFLYDLDIELSIKQGSFMPKTIDNKYISLSELSQYKFCPASYSINKSYNLPKSKVLDSSFIKGNKDGFYPRYLRYQQSKEVLASLEDIKNRLGKNEIHFFEKIFNSKILVNNSLDNTPRIFYSHDRKLAGSPDFLLELMGGMRVIVQEKFSSVSASDVQKIYDSDTIELEAYLTKFKALNINFGILLKWIWTMEEDPSNSSLKIMKVVGVKICSFRLEKCREVMVDNTIENIKNLLENVTLPAHNLGFANKCFNCSVSKYCSHKGGQLETLNLPYEIEKIYT